MGLGVGGISGGHCRAGRSLLCCSRYRQWSHILEAWSLTMAVSQGTSQQKYQLPNRCATQNRAGATSEGSDINEGTSLGLGCATVGLYHTCWGH